MTTNTSPSIYENIASDDRYLRSLSKQLPDAGVPPFDEHAFLRRFDRNLQHGQHAKSNPYNTTT
jgi:hypothetical protein